MTTNDTITFEAMEKELEALLGEMERSQAEFTARTDAALTRITDAMKIMVEEEENLDATIEKAADEAEAAVEEYANAVAREDEEIATSH